MSMELDREFEDEVVNEHDEDDRASLIGQIKEMHRQQATQEYVEHLPIPGKGRMLWAEFRPYPVSKASRKAKVIARRMESDDDNVVLDASCDTLIDACSEIKLLNPKFH